MIRIKPTYLLGKKPSTFLAVPLLLASYAFSQPAVIHEYLAKDTSSTSEMRFVPNGVNLFPNWGLEKVSEALDDGPVYTYPDTTHPVRLYLIDTAVANPGDWIGDNPNLVFEGTDLIRTSSDPETSSQFGHGTRMLSIIAGLETGVAPGTPIKVLNYDVYPDGSTTTVTRLAVAIVEAIAHHQDSDPQIPAVICLASASDMQGSSTLLQSIIQSAVDAGITVVVSAGNAGADATDYIPAAYGNIEGVICVGASNSSDQRIDISNSGTPVDILAPGDLIKAKDEVSADSFVLMRGTSPSAAIVTGTVLAELSLNGSLSPAEVEARIISAAVPSLTSGAAPVLRTTPTAAAHIALPDGLITDSESLVALGSSDFPVSANDSETSPVPSNSVAHQQAFNILHGANLEGNSPASATVLSPNEIGYSFPVDLLLIDDQDLFTLRNGYTWRIRCSDNFSSWDVPEGQLSKSTRSDGTVWLTARVPVTSDSFFLRIEVAPPNTP